jgi:pimeloyl-ACP methyl ester carboxylesterase
MQPESEPAVEARTPVLLVPGWSDRARVLARLRGRFLAAGWSSEAVAIVDFRDRFGSNIAHAGEVARAAAILLAGVGAESLDIVAHSMGGLAVRRYLTDDAAHRVRRVVFLGTPHSGTWAALLSWGGGRREMLPGSEFLRALPVPAVPCTTIRTPLDLRIFPRASARLAGVPDVVVGHASHQGLLRDRVVFDAILDALTARVSARTEPPTEPATTTG